MAAFNWTEHFVTGLDTVDGQHQHLIEMINHFGEALSNNALDFQQMESLLKELADYADYHFADEEDLMCKVGVDPRHLTLHRKEHAGFLEGVTRQAKHVDPEDADAAKSLLAFLVNWLAYHILVQDQNMARQIAAIRAGSKPAEAYEQQQREAASETEPLVATLIGLFEQVSQQNRALRQLNRDLEKKVAERTRALSTANRLLEELAATDPLTGLPNRRHALQRLRQLWREAEITGGVLSCLMVDADGFKGINDSHGHDAGDAVLQQLALTLSHAVRTDDVVCRLGGDEFLVICPNTAADGALHLGELIRSAVDVLRVPAGDGEWRGSVSVGVGAKTSEMAKAGE
ncbi:MAG: GGDEF domain-containing protein, partial [Deltaproteobacteria bacterium]|nr:GGDEF domain-containing protein [Deltaproteobacteria bacterium]